MSLSIAACCLAAAAAQSDEQRVRPVYPAGTDVVKVTATARDADGRVVSDLTAQDFTVYEDGRAQTVQLFASAVQPGQEESLALDVGLLFDTSGSMARQLRLTQEAAVRFLEAIPRARSLLTIFFDTDLRISRYDSEQQQGLFQRIVEARPTGMTALYDAIAVYLSRVHDSPGRRVLVLLTDGEDSTSALSLAETIALARSSPATIYAIAFQGEYAPGSTRALSARAFLHQLSKLTGGEVFAPTASKDLAPVFERILGDLSGQYLIGFVSDNPRRDGSYRKLKVESKRKDLKLWHRAGYWVPASR